MANEILSKGQAMGDGRVSKASFMGESRPEITSATQPITSDALVEQPQFEVVDSEPETQVDAGLGAVEEQVNQQDALSEAVSEQRQAAQSAESESFTDYISAQLSAATPSELEAQAFGIEGGVDEIQKELDSVNNEIRVEQHRLRRQVEAIERNAQGGLAGGVQAAINNAKRESFRSQADLAVVQMAVQGKYDSALDIANRAVDAYMEQQKIRLSALQMSYERNKDLYTTAEQREFELLLSDRERAQRREENAAKALNEVKVEALRMAATNGAPPEVVKAIGKAQSVEEIYGAGGQYAATDILDRKHKLAQINHIAFQESLAESEQLLRAIGKATEQQEKQELKVEKARADATTAATGSALAQKLKNFVAVDPETGQERGLAVVGSGSKLARWLGAGLTSGGSDFLAVRDQLVGIIGLEQRAKLKGTGTITDKEQDTAANAFSWINSEHSLNAPESRWVEETDRLIVLFDNAEVRAQYLAYTPEEREELGLTMDNDENKTVYQDGEAITRTVDDFDPSNHYE